MIAILLLATTFLILILLSVLILAYNIKRMTEKMEEINKRRFDELQDRITQTHNLITDKVTEIVKKFNDVI